MTTTQRLKAAIIAYLDDNSPDEAIAIVDSRQRAEIELPTLAVDIPSAEAHSIAIAHVQRCEVAITLRVHSGDDESIDGWIDAIETALNDPSSIRAAMTQGVRMDHWVYAGSEQTWDESVLEVVFSAECLVCRV